MSGHLQTEEDFDAFGEPKSIIKSVPKTALARPSHHDICDNFARTLRDLDAADLLYESLRDGGMSYVEARAAVEEFLRPEP